MKKWRGGGSARVSFKLIAKAVTVHGSVGGASGREKRKATRP